MDKPEGEDFRLTIVDVFTLTGRGTAVIGPIESGVLRTGDEVEIFDSKDRVVATARVTVEAIYSRHADPRSIGVLLGDVDRSLVAPGHTLRGEAAAP